jgi:Tol biopolymer transport system component
MANVKLQVQMAFGLVIVSAFVVRAVEKPPVPFISLPGKQSGVAFSPDGARIAFLWEGGPDGHTGIYVKSIGAGAPVRVTTGSNDQCCAVWSPDGQDIAFLRWGEEAGVFRVSAAGGPERKLLNKSIGSFDWSPDGKLLAAGVRGDITLFTLANGEERKLTSEKKDYAPVFSPDGQTLVFLRSLSNGVNDIYLVPVAGGAAKRLTSDNRQIEGLDWTEDGREIVYSKFDSGHAVWRVPIAGGHPRKVTGFGADAADLAVARRGHRLAYTESKYDTNIWRIPLKSGADSQAVPAPFIASAQLEDSPQYSPDGKRIVFGSNRSGQYQIWTCDDKGQNLAQLTSFETAWTGSPRWSPDGKLIAFDSRPQGQADIYVIGADGGTPRQLTSDPASDIVPSWSRDGRWVYFASNRTGSLQVWKEPVEGGPAIQVTKNGGFETAESKDGKFLYYSKQGPAGIWRVPVDGGDEMPIPELAEAAGRQRYWSLTDSGIYFVQMRTTLGPVLKFFDFQTHAVTQVLALDKDPVGGMAGLSVSPDGAWVLYAQADQDTARIMLVEGFQ